MSTTAYKNTDTENVFNEEQIVEKTENGYVVKTQTSWKLIPYTQVKKEIVYREYFDKEAPVFKESDTDLNPYLAYSNTSDSTFTEKLERRCGFKNLCIAMKKTAPVSGTVSLPINVGNTTFITVDGIITNTANGSVEISIIDNTDEIPILCDGTKRVEKEKLFFEQALRFLVDSEQPVTLYENNVVSKKDYRSLSAQEFQNNTYALSYTAAGDPNRYFPVSETIKIKVLIRQYIDAAPFVALKKVVIHKHGESLQWNSKA